MTPSRRIGIVLGSVHAFAFIIFLAIILLGKIERSQAALYWILWMPIDFPWSWIGVTAAGAWSDTIALAFDLPPWYAWIAIMTISHGVVGTIWWFIIPQAVALIFTRRGFLG
jgi:hypothetical protein